MLPKEKLFMTFYLEQTVINPTCKSAYRAPAKPLTQST